MGREWTVTVAAYFKGPCILSNILPTNNYEEMVESISNPLLCVFEVFVSHYLSLGMHHHTYSTLQML